MADTKMDPIELAYFAGFFDGEGCVAIYPKKYVVSLTNTDLRPLMRARELWGGYLSTQKATSRRFAVQDLWRWQIYGHSARDFLTAIRPFVLLKAEQVDVYLSALDSVPRVGGKYKPGDREIIGSSAAQLRILKKGA